MFNEIKIDLSLIKQNTIEATYEQIKKLNSNLPDKEYVYQLLYNHLSLYQILKKL